MATVDPVIASPRIRVGLAERDANLSIRLEGSFLLAGFGPISGHLTARATSGSILLLNEKGLVIFQSPSVRLAPEGDSFFRLDRIPLGSRFHWEREADLTFQGNLHLQVVGKEAICAINEIGLEDYLVSVISSEMNPRAPTEFLKAHAILSRSWLLAGLNRKDRAILPPRSSGEDEVLRIYERTEHELFDVCSEDHCQRYHGIAQIAPRAEEAVRQTRGQVVVWGDEICDTRYSKACGGITELYATAWSERHPPHLKSISDGIAPFPPLLTEQDVEAWIRSRPEAYCNLKDESLLETILTPIDRETKDFFRWRVEYPRKELEELLLERSGIDFGALKGFVPLLRGPSGRISRLRIVGSKRSLVVGKELEIRRWLSKSHLFSSAFVVTEEADRFVFEGAGWGHGVGLCQIGAAAMALLGFSAEEILNHYFPGTALKKIY